MPIPVKYLDTYEMLSPTIQDTAIFLVAEENETYNVTGRVLINYIKEHPDMDVKFVNEAEFASFINRKDNPHKVTKAQVGLGNADNTADAQKNVLSASKLTTGRQINGTLFDGTANITTAKWGTLRVLSLTGDVSGSISLDGSKDIALNVTVNNDSHSHTGATLPAASTTAKGITQLEDSLVSTSVTSAATPNSVRQVSQSVNTEITRAKAAEAALQNSLHTNKPIWDDKYTRNEIDNKFSTLETAIDWKESVNTFANIATTYPNPVDGWTVNVKDTDYTYRYNGTAWIVISANAIPKATSAVDGLLSKESKAAYDDANSKKHSHTNKSVLDTITQDSINNWNNASGPVSIPVATASTLGGVKIGSNISVSSGTISITKSNLTTALGYTPTRAVTSATEPTNLAVGDEWILEC